VNIKILLEILLMNNQKTAVPNQVDSIESVNPFDPSNLRLSQNYAESTSVKKLITTIPVRKPSKQDFVRVNPDPAFRLETAILELKEEKESYLVAPGTRSSTTSAIKMGSSICQYEPWGL
jgi:hypothetical protein